MLLDELPVRCKRSGAHLSEVEQGLVQQSVGEGCCQVWIVGRDAEFVEVILLARLYDHLSQQFVDAHVNAKLLYDLPDDEFALKHRHKSTPRTDDLVPGVRHSEVTEQRYFCRERSGDLKRNGGPVHRPGQGEGKQHGPQRRCHHKANQPQPLLDDSPVDYQLLNVHLYLPNFMCLSQDSAGSHQIAGILTFSRHSKCSTRSQRPTHRSKLVSPLR